MTVSGVSNTTASGALASSRQTIAQNFDTFLQLLTTQLRHQNPLDPLDTNQFTQQLVQFTGVEQQLKTNEFLQAMMDTSQNTNNAQAVSYVGKVVTASGTRTDLANGRAQWHFVAEKDASISATVRDMDGNVVYTKTGTVSQGESVFTWDGVGNDGLRKPDGAYSVTIEGRDSEGGFVGIGTEMTGQVTGVDFTGSEPVLMVGSARVNLSSVLSVRTVETAE